MWDFCGLRDSALCVHQTSVATVISPGLRLAHVLFSPNICCRHRDGVCHLSLPSAPHGLPLKIRYTLEIAALESERRKLKGKVDMFQRQVVNSAPYPPKPMMPSRGHAGEALADLQSFLFGSSVAKAGVWRKTRGLELSFHTLLCECVRYLVAVCPLAAARSVVR